MLEKNVCFNPRERFEHVYARPDKWKYIEMISARGDSSGGHNGTLDLLAWCGKAGTGEVTLDEAQRFWNNPEAPYAREK